MINLTIVNITVISPFDLDRDGTGLLGESVSFGGKWWRVKAIERPLGEPTPAGTPIRIILDADRPFP